MELLKKLDTNVSLGDTLCHVHEPLLYIFFILSSLSYQSLVFDITSPRIRGIFKYLDTNVYINATVCRVHEP